jgi:hypothetical protein
MNHDLCKSVEISIDTRSFVKDRAFDQ